MKMSLLKIPSLLLASAACLTVGPAPGIVKPSGLVDDGPPRPEPLRVGGVFHGQHVRDGRVIEEWEDHNLVVNQGLDHILATEFTGGAQVTTWYLSLFGNNYVPTGGDTAASIARNAGELTGFTNTSRVPYTGVEGGQSVTNAAAPASFTSNAQADQQVYGAFLISSQGIGSTAGTLFAAAQFTTPKTVSKGDQLLLTYAFAAASA